MDPEEEEEEEGRQAAMTHWSLGFMSCLVADHQRVYRKDA
jgi:hypothetical protein